MPVSDLAEGGVHGAREAEAVREGLELRRLADGDDPGLGRVVVDVRVGVLAQVRHEGARRLVGLHLAPLVGELPRIVGRHVSVVELRPRCRSFRKHLPVTPGLPEGLLEEALGGRVVAGVVVARLHRPEELEVPRAERANDVIEERAALEPRPRAHLAGVGRRLRSRHVLDGLVEAPCAAGD